MPHGPANEEPLVNHMSIVTSKSRKSRHRQSTYIYIYIRMYNNHLQYVLDVHARSGEKTNNCVHAFTCSGSNYRLHGLIFRTMIFSIFWFKHVPPPLLPTINPFLGTSVCYHQGKLGSNMSKQTALVPVAGKEPSVCTTKGR